MERIRGIPIFPKAKKGIWIHKVNSLLKDLLILKYFNNHLNYYYDILNGKNSSKTQK